MSQAKIMVEWTSGKSTGKRSWVKRTDVKEGRIVIGEKVKVIWGKSKKLYEAVVANAESILSPTIPIQRSSNDDEGFLFELGSPPRSEGPINENEQATEMLCAIKDIVQDLKDFTSRECARLVSRMDSLEKVVKNLAERLESMSDVALPDMPISTPQTQVLSTQRPVPSFEDRTNFISTLNQRPVPFEERTNFVSPLNQSGGEDTYSIPPTLVASCLHGCKSRRNLAGRLAAQIFPAEERKLSNVKGALGKKRLDPLKANAIFTVCLQKFPLDRLETRLLAEKDMRNAVDETCRKTKIPGCEN